MNKLSIEELIKYAEEKVANLTKVIDQSAFTNIKDRLIEERQLAQVGLDALREVLKGDQVPVAIGADIIRDANRYRFLRDEDAWGEDSDSWDVETRTGLISSENLMGGLSPDHFDAAVDARMAASDIPFLNPTTVPKRTVLLLNSSTVMSRAYVVKQIEAAGCIVQTGATDKEDDYQPSAPAVLQDVLTAVSIGGSRTELIDALTAIKPKFGAHGSRDVDVRAAHAAIDKAIEKLSNL